MTRDYHSAIELYKQTVTGLETKITKRQQVLEQLDAASGAISAEPSLLQYFGKKQAYYLTTVSEAKRMLCDKIRDKVAASLRATASTPI